MPRPTRATLALKALGKFADYPITDEQVRRVFANAGPLEGARLKAARELFQGGMRRQNEWHEQDVRDFFLEMAGRHPGSGFDRLGFTFFNTDAPNAVALHDRGDDSYAVGLDYGMLSIISSVFPPLLHARLKNLENLTWTEVLADFVLFQIFNRKDGLRQRSAERMKEHRYLEDVSTSALNMALHFILGHELGHIHLGHFKRGQATQLKALGLGDGTEEISTFAHQMEHEADAWGVEELRRGAAGDPVAQALARHLPSIYFGIFALAENLYAPRSDLGRHVKDSHPASWDRARRLRPSGAQGPAPSDEKAAAIGDLLCLIEEEQASPAFHKAVGHFFEYLWFSGGG